MTDCKKRCSVFGSNAASRDAFVEDSRWIGPECKEYDREQNNCAAETPNDIAVVEKASTPGHIQKSECAGIKWFEMETKQMFTGDVTTASTCGICSDSAKCMKGKKLCPETGTMMGEGFKSSVIYSRVANVATSEDHCLICDKNTYGMTPSIRSCAARPLAGQVTRSVGSTSVSDCYCPAGSISRGGACTKCAAGRTTPGIIYKWRKITGSRCKAYTSTARNWDSEPVKGDPQPRFYGVTLAELAACQYRCYGSDCEGVMWDQDQGASSGICNLCSDASEGITEGNSLERHVRFPIGATSSAQCSVCDKNFYMKGSVCTACPLGKVTLAVGSVSASQCQCGCAAGVYSSGSGSCPQCKLGRTTPGMIHTLPWKAPTTVERCATSKEARQFGSTEASAAACQKRCRDLPTVVFANGLSTPFSCRGIEYAAAAKECCTCLAISKNPFGNQICPQSTCVEEKYDISTVCPRTPAGATSAVHCSTCDNNFYLENSVCTVCPNGTAQAQIASTTIDDCKCAADQCCPAGSWGLQRTNCTACDEGFMSTAGALRKGRCRRCPVAERCKDGKCANGTTGMGCAYCLPNHFNEGVTCNSCDEQSFVSKLTSRGFQIFGLLVVIVICLALMFWRISKIDLAKVEVKKKEQNSPDADNLAADLKAEFAAKIAR